MKKQKNYYKKLWIILISMLWLWFSIVYATWSTKYLSYDKADFVWANGSEIEFSVVPDGNSFATYYTNREDNSSIIWNYFSGYYYDSVYWFFKLDWNSSWNSNNVRIINSTDKCDWYWYKLGWYAYSENFWFVDFSYNDTYFVYYCVNDKELHWYAYLENIWFQSFEWIWFEIIPEVVSDANIIESDDFVNDNTEITNPNYDNPEQVIHWNIQHIKDTDWSVFYIIK